MAEIPAETGAMCHWPTVQAMPNARESLKVLSTMAHCHLATNAKDSAPYDIMRALVRVGLDSFLGRIFCFRAIGHTTPSVEFFEYIANDLQVRPQALIRVGDDLEKDVLGAQAQGLQAVWYNPQCRPVPTGIVAIRNLLELPRMTQHIKWRD